MVGNQVDRIGNKTMWPFSRRVTPTKDEPAPMAEPIVNINTLEELLPLLNTEDVKKVLNELAEQSITRFKQEILAGNTTQLERELRKFDAGVSRRAWKAAQKWTKWTEDGPILFPDNTKLFYKQGNTEVLVQEFPPQIRLMKFRENLAIGEKSKGVDQSEAVHKLSLALPYIVFISRFQSGLFTDCYLAFNDRPMKNLNETPLRPYLSNIDTNLRVCLGGSFDSRQLQAHNIAQQTAYVLTNFWATVYSDEWSTHFWNSKNHFASDARMNTLQNWQTASAENSLFVIEDVQWLKYSQQSFGKVILRLFDSDSGKCGLQNELFDDLSENYLKVVNKMITDNLAAAQNKSNINVDKLADDLVNKIAELVKAKQGS